MVPPWFVRALGAGTSAGTKPYPGAVTGAPVAACAGGKAPSRRAAPRPCSAVHSAPFSTVRALCCVSHRLLFSSLPLLKIKLHLVYDKTACSSRGNFCLATPYSSPPHRRWKSHTTRQNPRCRSGAGGRFSGTPALPPAWRDRRSRPPGLWEWQDSSGRYG